jgi:hypothetical protein
MTQPHYIDRACQKCGGEIQGWTCQGCGQVFRENDAGALVFAPMETVAWREKAIDTCMKSMERLEQAADMLDRTSPTRHDLKGMAKLLREWRDKIVQALAVIPTQGGEGQ